MVAIKFWYAHVMEVRFWGDIIGRSNGNIEDDTTKSFMAVLLNNRDSLVSFHDMKISF